MKNQIKWEYKGEKFDLMTKLVFGSEGWEKFSKGKRVEYQHDLSGEEVVFLLFNQ